MSYMDFEEAIQLISDNKESCDVMHSSSQGDIHRVEDILKVQLPESYKIFLSKFDNWGLGSQCIYGIYADAIVKMTQYSRSNYQENPEFPPSFVCIHELGNGEISCLDTSRMNEDGECPVVGWYFGHVEDIAEDFGSFLLEKVQWGLESLEKEK